MFKEPHRRFLEFLRSRNLKLTAQRSVVLDTLVDSCKHCTAEELHEKARKADPHLGLSTVYRNVKLLEEAGLVTAHNYEDASTRYEMCEPSGCRHDHLICDQCGAIIDVPDPEIEELCQRLAQNHGARLHGHRLYLYGLCSACLDTQKQQS